MATADTPQWLVGISQKTYPGVGDVDECWLIATYICARYHEPGCHLPTVAEGRAAANNPDRPGPTGGTLTDIMEVLTKLFPTFGARRFLSTDWVQFRNYCDQGWVAAVGVLSSELPAALRYNFLGEHEIAVQRVNGTWYIVNPLAATGSKPQAISDGTLKTAVFTFVGASRIQAALVPPPGKETDMPTIANYLPGQIATIGAGANIRAEATSASGLLRKLTADEKWSVVGWVKGELTLGSDQWLCRVAQGTSGGKWEYTHKTNVTAGPTSPTVALEAKVATLTTSLEQAEAARVAALQQAATAKDAERERIALAEAERIKAL